MFKRSTSGAAMRHFSVSSTPRRALPAFLTLTALASAIVTAPSYAQSRDDNAGAPFLEEITVTATRQEASVNRVAMSISALSQDAITEQGIYTGADLERLVPGLQFSEGGGDRNPSFTIRGINGGSVGSQTTGFYLDDSALQRRMVNGLQTGNGAPFPNLYDVERVEVLRGPQGTLYGDSSEGGTIRFITPTPSLTEYSGRARVGGSITEQGEASKEFGLAFGGPLIEDVLGFRLSGSFRHQGGWIDSKSVYDGLTFSEDNNWTESKYLRLSTLWQVNDKFSLTPAIYWGRDMSNDDAGAWGPSPQLTFSGSIIRNGIPNPDIDYSKYGVNSRPVAGFSTSNRPSRNADTGLSNGNYTTNPGGTLGYTDPNGNAVTYWYAALDQEVPGFVQNAMPWYNYDSNGNGLYNSTEPGDVQYVASPRVSRMILPSLTLDYAFDTFDMRSITSYVSDKTDGYSFGGGNAGGNRSLGSYIYGSSDCREGFNIPRPGMNPGDTPDMDVCYNTPRWMPGFPGHADWYFYENQRESKSEELRFASNTDGKLVWVGGLYYAVSDIHMHGRETSNEDAVARHLSGISGIWRARGYPLPQWGVNSPPGTGPFDTWQQDVSDREVWLTEDTKAVFAEFNYEFIEGLTLTVGARWNDYEQTYRQQYGALVSGFPPRITVPGLEDDAFNPDPAMVQAISRDPTRPNGRDNPIVDLESLVAQQTMFPTDLAGCPDSPDCGIQYTQLTSAEKNVTTKVSLGWQINDDNLLYAIYAEGFRPGGVNPPVPASGQCEQALADLGLVQSPLTYRQDTVESYEIGNKSRLFDGRMQLNGAAYQIIWKDIQYTQNVACGFNYLNNAGKGISEGVEVSTTARLGNWTIGVNATWARAYYAEDVRANGNDPDSQIVRNKTDNLPSAPADWVFSFSPAYNFEINGHRGSVRMDASYNDSYRTGSLLEKQRWQQGLSNNYNPITFYSLSSYTVNARASIELGGVDWALSINNLDNHQQKRRNPGATTNGDVSYLNGNFARPRTISLQANYEF
jgi:outer membrane receptor protein involved in Fe transport